MLHSDTRFNQARYSQKSEPKSLSPKTPAKFTESECSPDLANLKLIRLPQDIDLDLPVLEVELEGFLGTSVIVEVASPIGSNEMLSNEYTKSSRPPSP